MASSSHRRSRARSDRRGFRVPLVAVGAVASVALLVSLVVAFRPGGGTATTADARDGSTPVVEAGTSTSATPTASPSRSTPSPSSSASPTTTPPSPTPARASARPSATSAAAPRKPASSSTGSLTGRIRPGTTYQGVATAYDIGDGNGACSFGPTSDVMTAAMNTADYETSKACGAYVAVHAGGKSITVRITNECPAPCQAGQLDLSRQAFAKLAPLSTGRIPITWNLLSPETSDKISIRYKTGSTQYWCGIQALGHRNPVARLEVRTGGGWVALPRTGYNYFLSEQGNGCGSTIRLTDIYGERLTIDGIAVRADVVQPTGVQFARH